MRIRRQYHISHSGFLLAPTISVSLLFLLSLAYTTELTGGQKQADIHLPLTANTAFSGQPSGGDIINIDAGGSCYLGSTAVSAGQLRQHFKQRLTDRPPLRICIRADRDTPGKKIKELMHVAADCGASEVVFAGYPQ